MRPGAGRGGEVLGAEADEAARRDPVLEPQPAAAVRLHGEQLALALGEAAHHRALVVLREIHGELFPGLAAHAVDVLLDDLRPRHRQLVAFAAHVLDQDGQVQLAAAGDLELVRVVRVLDAQRDVVQQLLLEALADLAAGEVLAFLAGERRLVDLEGHADGRLVHLQRRQPFGLIAVAERVGDAQVLDAAEGDDVAGRRVLDALALQAHEAVQLHRARPLRTLPSAATTLTGGVGGRPCRG